MAVELTGPIRQACPFGFLIQVYCVLSGVGAICDAATGPAGGLVQELADDLRRLRRGFFWTGNSTPETAGGVWQESLKRLFILAGVPDGHAHRFRDTFSMGLLLAGVPIQRVSILLGHQSARITEKHYAPWVRERQEQLETDIASGTSDLHSRAPPPAPCFLAASGYLIRHRVYEQEY